MEITDQSVVSSGVYERNFIQDGVNYHHILNPKDGYPYQNGLTDVTIVSPESVDGDGLSTTCFSLGLEEGMKLANSLGRSLRIFYYRGRNDPLFKRSKGFACKVGKW